MPSYRVLRQTKEGDWVDAGGIVWGQDETNVVEDLIAGWDSENATSIAEPRKIGLRSTKTDARL